LVSCVVISRQDRGRREGGQPLGSHLVRGEDPPHTTAARGQIFFRRCVQYGRAAGYKGNVQHLSENLDGLFQVMDLSSILPPETWKAGMAQLKTELRRLGLEAEAAIAKDLTFSAAAVDFDNFPLLARLHAGVDDILTLSLPPEVVQWIFRFLARIDEIEPHLDGVTEELVQLAALPVEFSDPTPALARFVLFELVRVQLILLARRHPHEVFGHGLELDDLSPIAEKQVELWLKEAPPAEVRSRLVLEAAACVGLSVHVAVLTTELDRVGKDIHAGMVRRAEIEAELSQCEARDSLLIRNGLAPGLGIQQLTIEELRSRHPIAMGDVSVEALYKRFQRLKKRGKIPKREHIALLDVIKMIVDDEDEGGAP